MEDYWSVEGRQTSQMSVYQSAKKVAALSGKPRRWLQGVICCQNGPEVPVDSQSPADSRGCAADRQGYADRPCRLSRLPATEFQRRFFAWPRIVFLRRIQLGVLLASAIGAGVAHFRHDSDQRIVPPAISSLASC